MHVSLVTLCLLAALPIMVESYLMYRDRIPNGDHVPHPCKPNELWKGVGHFNVDGGGHRNPFGVDFKEAGLTWTKELCSKDSDGDGRTNGEELGDPACVWQPDDLPTRTTHITHPGVCDPYDSLACREKTFDHVVFRNQDEWMENACKRSEFVCEGLDSPDVKNQTVRFPVTQVPAKETTYICKIFDFQEGTEDIHMIATAPILDNRHVMHHMVLFGCDGENDTRGGVPYECDMLPTRHCQTILSIWSLGINGDCMANNAGMRIGKKGYTRFALQFHWNNPEEIANYNDSSGMTLYYTKNLRPHDLGVWTTGSNQFYIPPRKKWVEVNSLCSSTCTKNLLTQPAYITMAFNHMHYLGVRMTIEHIRDGQTLDNITSELFYSYDSPKLHQYANPIEVRPGDELRTRCYFNSMSRTTITEFGDSTQQEMCFGFMSYYPQSALSNPFCLSRGSISTCDPATLGGCDRSSFWEYLHQQLIPAVEAKCTAQGPCLKDCKAAIVEAKRNQPCLRLADYWEWHRAWMFKYPANSRFLGGLASCEAEIARDEALISIPGTSDGSSSMAQGGVVVALLAFLFSVVF